MITGFYDASFLPVSEKPLTFSVPQQLGRSKLQAKPLGDCGPRAADFRFCSEFTSKALLSYSGCFAGRERSKWKPASPVPKKQQTSLWIHPVLQEETKRHIQSRSGHSRAPHTEGASLSQPKPSNIMAGYKPYRRPGTLETQHGDSEHGMNPGNGFSIGAGALTAGYVPLQIPTEVGRPASALGNILVACIAAGLFGYHLGIVNGPLGYIARDLGFAGNTLLQGWVVSIFLFGAFLGCCISSTLADSLGRKKSLQLAALPILVGTLFSATASHYMPMIFGRSLCGFGLGMSSPVMALYISEISPTERRGTFGCLSQIFTCMGILAALVASLPLPYTPGWWRACFWFGTFPSALLILGMEFCAESPRWLAKKGRWADAERAAETLWGPSMVKSAMMELHGSGPLENEKEVGWLDLLNRRYIKVVGIGAAVFGLQQLAGINAIFYFSSTIFSSAGIKSDMLASTVMGLVNFLAAVSSMLLMDRLGRKKLMAWSFAGMGMAMAVQAFFQALPALQSFAPTVSVVGTLTYVISFALGAGPVPALLLPEIFPGRIRAKAMAVAMCVHWIFNFLIGLCFLPLLQSWGAPTLYCCFAAICFLAVLFTHHQIIETKGRSLEEIERLLVPET